MLPFDSFTRASDFTLESECIIELTAPNNPEDYEQFYARNEPLFYPCLEISLASHRVIDGVLTTTGFERNYSFVQFLLLKRPIFKIKFHITCFDLNRLNIKPRLRLLADLGVRQILIVTGDGYNKARQASCSTTGATSTSIWFDDSSDMIRYITENAHLSLYISAIAIAAYPGNDPEQECERLVRKIGLSNKIHYVYTQCIFTLDELKPILDALAPDKISRSVQVIPSIAIFNDMVSLNRINKYIRMSVDRYNDLENYSRIMERCEAITSPQLECNPIEVYLQVLGAYLTHCGFKSNISILGNIETGKKVIEAIYFMSGIEYNREHDRYIQYGNNIPCYFDG